MADIRYHKMIYYKYPSTWIKIHVFKSDHLFYFFLRASFRQKTCWQQLKKIKIKNKYINGEVIK